MAFDPTKSDVQRLAEKVDEKFEDATVLITPYNGQNMICVTPYDEESLEVAQEIRDYLKEKGLTTSIQDRGVDGSTVYEVTGTSTQWKVDT